MHKDKLTLSQHQIDAIKLQIRAQLKHMKPKPEQVNYSRTPPQRRHYMDETRMRGILDLQGNCPSPTFNQRGGKRHYNKTQNSLSPANIHRQRKHFPQSNISQIKIQDDKAKQRDLSQLGKSSSVSRFTKQSVLKEKDFNRTTKHNRFD